MATPSGAYVLYFFLSSAPEEEEIFVERFYHDLSSEVRERAPATSTRDVGFLDLRRLDSHPWPPDTRAALSTTQTFVPLCSAAYFLSSTCGRAWSVFIDRLRRHELETGHRSRALIPVTWSAYGLPADALDEAGLDIVPHRTPGNEDLRVLIRLRSHRSAYRAFVASLAHHVVEVAHGQRLSPSPPGTDVDQAASAFDLRPRWAEAEDAPQRVHFLVAAGSREQMRQVRTDLQYYGADSGEWAPYRPTAAEPLADLARGIAARCHFGSEVAPIEAIEDHLAAARQRNGIVVLLVDAWATQLEMLRETLRGIDERHDMEVAILIPESREDSETRRHSGELASAVRRALPAGVRRNDPTFRTGIESVSRFDADLVRALAEVSYRQRLPRGSRAASGVRPILRGP